MFSNLAVLLAAALFPAAVLSFDSYPNAFVNATYMVAKNFPPSTVVAQNTILTWADQIAEFGPWSVMNKSITPPTGNKHTYMSWAPYSWPDCSKAGNKTELTPEQIWVTCPYVTRDGQFNPDRLLVNDTGNANAMADAVFYNSLAWAINGSQHYEQNVVRFINYWFLSPDTYMLPNLEYGQMLRGPKGQTGAHTGLLDMKCMAKVATGIQILREGKSTLWTSDIDNQMKNWTSTYLNWVETAPLALAEKGTINNHGTFYYNQLASLKIIVGDTAGAKDTLQEYFQGMYQVQIDADGKQPLELERTHPYHYTAYNLAAVIVNAQLAEYVGYDAWNIRTKKGGSIKGALDYAIGLAPGDEPPSELYILVAIGGSVYGDPDGKYAAFLKGVEAQYPSEPYFAWAQPMSDSGWVAANVNSTGGGSTDGGSSGASDRNGAVGGRRVCGGFLLLCSSVLVSWILFA